MAPGARLGYYIANGLLVVESVRGRFYYRTYTYLVMYLLSC
jgi:hypothetical protein